MTPQDDKPKQAREWRAEDLGYDGWYIVDGHGNHPKNPSLFVEKSAYDSLYSRFNQQVYECDKTAQERDRAEKERDELKAVLQSLNAHVLPGEIDSIDSAKMIIKERDQLKEQLKDHQDDWNRAKEALAEFEAAKK